ncbi:FAD-dependent oxidoreductase [Rhodothalassium salexigens]|uniref:NAD(P)/FAD-dependent oxidoreductase n=1 Tax=Rhodothalassium salexigens TaxID=1086 RepID=UPI001914A5FC|nr:NAD(P)/FAD-dependent oxidoreductase [Rhodothalassium salexigens]MBK5911599.1 FAD-dependent oxidoreductase [Rhodothalassium salexigens]MBK5920892.1 FAD-dependent oxidoreductase [Rhodothalassium salexigens]
MASAKKNQIVVVGGGAGGLELVRRLGARYGRDEHDIILVEKNRTHIWKPLLHEVAAGSLDANMDEVGYGGHAVRWGYRFFNGALESIDRDRRQIVTKPMFDAEGREVVGRHHIRYDYLVLSVGGVSNDFGTPGVAEHALFLENRRQADDFRGRLLNACLRVSHLAANQGADDARVRVCIVGGGATGVELAAELYNAAAALRHYGLEVFDESRMDVTLIEAGPRILPALPENIAGAAHEELENLGVEVLTGTMVTKMDETHVHTKDGRAIRADLKVWAAGVKAPDFLGSLDLETNRINQIVVRPTLQTTVDDRIFALGDCASCLLPGRDRPVPPRAQAAHQMAEAAFENLKRIQDGRPLKNFVYRDRGSLVSLSRYSTIGSLMGNLVGGRMAVEGRVARFAYLSLYRLHLIAVHGWLKGWTLIVLGHVNQIVRPRLKLH